MIETFTGAPETRWRFFADTVMGGVSSGNLAFVTEGGRVHARMTGKVSTANNGGFIQIRMNLANPPPAEIEGVRLVLRGNHQLYFVHLRTTGTLLPWQYYQAGFEVGMEWNEVRLPLARFKPSRSMTSTIASAESLRSIGIVAYGRDHEAEIEIREVAFY
ncbi:MAG: CIA30 family protein [Methylobacterium sp.]|nr:CIA30 family protein [Methylobacterium sp.]MCA3676015.1 CIA30 family protein [Methylobacterium sp.]MCA3704390.1 CIA30 family protein [Methylobacterium sp.]